MAAVSFPVAQVSGNLPCRRFPNRQALQQNSDAVDALLVMAHPHHWHMVTPPPNPVALTPEQRRGRVILAAALGFWLFVAVCIDALVLAIGNIQTLAVIWARLAITVGLFYAVWIGQRWARWLTVGIFIIAFLLAVRHLILKPSPFLLLHTLLFLAICLMFVFVLVISRPVAAFLSYQQARR
jgi:hypothetical protein